MADTANRTVIIRITDQAGEEHARFETRHPEWSFEQYTRNRPAENLTYRTADATA